MKVYYDKNCDKNLIKNKKVSIIGFGSQGHAHALNLKDSGVKNIVVGLKRNSSSINKAKKAGLTVLPPEKAIEHGEVIMILIPDELQPELYKNVIEKKIAKNAYLGFAHGFSIHFKFIKPRKDLNIFMVAPKGPGHLVRSEYENKRGVPCLLAIDKSDGSYVVIELKRNQTSDDTVGQVTRYMGWIEEKLKSNVKGIIIAGKYDEKLYYAQTRLKDVEVFLYEVNFQL